MVRKPVFTREEIVMAGLQIVRHDGMGQLSARRVAEELGSSTAPVYSNFRNMEELESEVKTAAVELLLGYAARRYSDDPFLDMGLGVLDFARAESRLYAALFLDPPGACDPGPLVMDKLLAIMADIPGLADLDPVERMILLNKMAIFTHGLAVEICQERTEQIQEQALRLLLAEAGEAIVKDAFERPKRTPEELAAFSSLCQKAFTADINTHEDGKGDGTDA